MPDAKPFPEPARCPTCGSIGPDGYDHAVKALHDNAAQMFDVLHTQSDALNKQRRNMWVWLVMLNVWYAGWTVWTWYAAPHGGR